MTTGSSSRPHGQDVSGVPRTPCRRSGPEWRGLALETGSELSEARHGEVRLAPDRDLHRARRRTAGAMKARERTPPRLAVPRLSTYPPSRQPIAPRVADGPNTIARCWHARSAGTTVSQHWKARNDSDEGSRVGRGQCRGATTSRRRPVSRSNTSSRVSRRTSKVNGVQATRLDRGHRRVPVGDVEQDPVGQDLGPFGRYPPACPLRVVHVRANRSSRTSGGSSARSGRAANPRRRYGRRPSRQPVAQLLGLVHVVRRQDQRDAVLLEPEQPVPDQCRACGSRPVVGSSRSRISGSFTSDRAMVSRRFMPPDSGSTWSSARSVSWTNSSSSVGPLPATRRGHAEVPPVDQQVLPDGQLGVEGVLLRHDAEPGPDRGRRGPGPPRIPSSPRSAARRRRSSAWWTTCRRRSAEEPERLAADTSKSIPSTAVKRRTA